MYDKIKDKNFIIIKITETLSYNNEIIFIDYMQSQTVSTNFFLLFCFISDTILLIVMLFSKYYTHVNILNKKDSPVFKRKQCCLKR
jgi:hypothetical protein